MHMNWNYPTSVRVGSGRASEIPAACSELGMKAPLLVTDPGLSSLPMVGEIVGQCEQFGLRCRVFSDVKPNPTGSNVIKGVAAFKDGDHDGVIALGGGSGLDAGKAIAFMAGQSRPIWDFEDVGDNWTRALEDTISPILGVPTTAGTGSEVGRASVILDERSETKKIIFHPRMLPQVVILDPLLTLGLPGPLTAATGMDALSHSLEAYCSPLYHPMAEGIAVEGIRLVKEHLPTAVRDGANVDSRTQMLVASTMGATAFQRGLGAMHALAHPLGALYDAHHGTLNAVLMPYVLQANRPAIEDRLSRLSRYLELSDATFESFLTWVSGLRSEIGIPHTLLELGISADQADRVAQMAVNDPSASTNPIPFDVDGYKKILLRAIEGHLEGA